MNKNIFYIGGSTCCGKSTVAEMLCSNGDFKYYKLDDDLFTFLDAMAAAGHKVAAFQKNAAVDEIWLRDPKRQNEEELLFYSDMMPMAFEKLSQMRSGQRVLTEGAGYLPSLMNERGVPKNRYVCIVPTREFRLCEYKKRPWIGQVLDGSTNKEQAFSNWMERDALFAEFVIKDAHRFGYATYIVDGSKPVDATLDFVKSVFGIK